MDVQPTLFLLQYLAMTDWHTESLHKATIDFASNSRFTTDDFTSHPFIHILPTTLPITITDQYLEAGHRLEVAPDFDNLAVDALVAALCRRSF